MLYICDAFKEFIKRVALWIVLHVFVYWLCCKSAWVKRSYVDKDFPNDFVKMTHIVMRWDFACILIDFILLYKTALYIVVNDTK